MKQAWNHRAQPQQQQNPHPHQPALASSSLSFSWTSRNNAVRAPSQDPWKHVSFLKDAKLRARERYWRSMEDYSVVVGSGGDNNNNNNTTNVPSPKAMKVLRIFPDALTWRKYLKLLQELIQMKSSRKRKNWGENHLLEDTNENETKKNGTRVEWILLESVAEFLDHRHRSATIPVPEVVQDTTNDTTTFLSETSSDSLAWHAESAAPQERTTLVRLVQEHSSPIQPNSMVRAFCDLSVRDNEQDEWDWLDYSHLSIGQRSRHAVLRAARLLLQQQYHHATDHDIYQTTSVILLTKDSHQPRIASDHTDTTDEELDHIQLEPGEVQLTSMESLLDLLVHEHVLDRTQWEYFRELQQSCEQDYDRRNHLTSQSLTTTKDVDTEHWKPDQVQAGLAARTLVRGGRLQVTKENPQEAYVLVENTNYFIDNKRGHGNRAFHQDAVILQILPTEQWGRPVGRRRIVTVRDDDDDDDDDEKNDDGDDLRAPPVPSARVVAIHKPARRIFVATLVDVPSSSDVSHMLVVPMDIRIPKIRLQAKRSWKKYVGMRLKVEVDGWEVGSKYPSGRCVEILGSIGDLETELQALLLENEVDIDPFSPSALACLPPQGDQWTIPISEFKLRRDLRTSRHIFSVDPPGCQDIDDTMHAVTLPNGDVEIGVHIADVTHFLRHNSALDREAQARGTTFYLVDRRFDMLPALLSSNLCSLHGNMDRLSVSVIWTLSSDLETVKSCWYGRTIINNCAGT